MGKTIVRAADIPRIQYGDTIDYTRFRIGAKVDGKVIRKCPRCGKKGAHYEARMKPDKPLMFYVTHRTRLCAGPFPHWSTDVGDHCAGRVES